MTAGASLHGILAQTPPSLPADQVVAFVFLDIVIILVAARIVGMLFVRVGQPRVVGEIVAGVLLGPSLLGATVFTWGGAPDVLACDRALGSTADPSITACIFPPQARSVLGIVGQIALALFMFLVGLELDFKLIRGRLKGAIVVGVGVVAVPLLAAFAIAPVLYGDKFVAAWDTPDQPSRLAFALMIGAMLSVTAFPVAVRILQEKGMHTSALGAVTIVAAAIVTVLMFLVVGVARGVAADQGAGAQLARFVGAAVYIVAMAVIVRPLLDRTIGSALRRNPKLTGDVFAVALGTLLLSAYVADRIGINVIVGAFVAGAVLPERGLLLRELSVRLTDLTIIVLLPVFLAFSGLNTDFTKLRLEHLAGIALFLVAGIASKWGGGYLCGRLGGLDNHESNVVGVLMNCRGLLVLVVALIAVNSSVITAPMQIGGVLMALVTTAMTGPLIDRALASQTSPGAQAPEPVL